MESINAMHIIDGIRSKNAPVASSDEIDELKKDGMILAYSAGVSVPDLERSIASFKDQFSQTTSEMQGIVDNLMQAKFDYQSLWFIQRISANLRIGKAGEFKARIKRLEDELRQKEEDLGFIKANLLRTVANRDALNQCVEINGEYIMSTSIGKSMSDQIRGRSRFHHLSLSEMTTYLQKLDQKSVAIMGDIQKKISGRQFSLIWLPYLYNLNMIDMVNKFDTLALNDYSYENVEKKMMQYIINRLYSREDRRLRHPRYDTRAQKILQNDILTVANRIKRNTRKSTYIAGILAELLEMYKPQNVIRNQYASSQVGQISIAQLNDLLFPKDLHPGNVYITRLQEIIEHLNKPEGIQFGVVGTEHSLIALMILGLSDDPKKFNFFYPKINAVPEGARFFAAILALLPWSAEETWQIHMRVESSVLRAQSAQFMPELMEYSLMIQMNPEFVKLADNVTPEFLVRWQLINLPAILAVHVTSLQSQIEKYIKDRPLSYITNPRPYYRSTGYYYYHYRPYYGYYGWYYRRRHPSSTNYYGSRTSTGRSTGSRYSSLHHHTIG